MRKIGIYFIPISRRHTWYTADGLAERLLRTSKSMYGSHDKKNRYRPNPTQDFGHSVPTAQRIGMATFACSGFDYSSTQYDTCRLVLSISRFLHGARSSRSLCIRLPPL